MKLQKNIIIWSLIIMLLSISGIFFFDKNMKLYDICVGIFTGTILTVLTAMILYNYEKKKLLNNSFFYSVRIPYIPKIPVRKVPFRYCFPYQKNFPSVKQPTYLSTYRVYIGGHRQSLL